MGKPDVGLQPVRNLCRRRRPIRRRDDDIASPLVEVPRKVSRHDFAPCGNLCQHYCNDFVHTLLVRFGGPNGFLQ